MSFKICYCNKASNNVVMTFEKIRHFDKHICNVILTLFLYLMQTYHNERDLNIIKNIKIIKKLVT